MLYLYFTNSKHHQQDGNVEKKHKISNGSKAIKQNKTAEFWNTSGRRLRKVGRVLKTIKGNCGHSDADSHRNNIASLNNRTLAPAIVVIDDRTRCHVGIISLLIFNRNCSMKSPFTSWMVFLSIIIASDRGDLTLSIIKLLTVRSVIWCKLGKIDSVRSGWSVRVGFGLCSSCYDLLTYPTQTHVLLSGPT